MARRASKHFCVTDALRVWLRENFGETQLESSGMCVSMRPGY